MNFSDSIATIREDYRPAGGLPGLLRATAGMSDADADRWLSSDSGTLCSCGGSLSNAERLSGMCDRCLTAADDHAERKVDGLDARRSALIPERFLHCTVASWHGSLPSNLAAWRSCTDEPLLLLGPNGTGKTHLATAMLVEQIEAGRRCTWTSAAWAAAALTDELSSDERRLWRRLLTCEVLLLDDLAPFLTGSSGKQRWGDEQLDLLICERYNAGRGLIGTANLTEKQVYGANSRLGSRLCSGVRIEMTGKDWRVS